MDVTTEEIYRNHCRNRSKQSNKCGAQCITKCTLWSRTHNGVVIADTTMHTQT